MTAKGMLNKSTQPQVTYGTKYSRVDQVNLWKAAFPFKFFKCCLPQILLGPLLNTLSHITLSGFTFNRAQVKNLYEIPFFNFIVLADA